MTARRSSSPGCSAFFGGISLSVTWSIISFAVIKSRFVHERKIKGLEFTIGFLDIAVVALEAVLVHELKKDFLLL